MYNEGDYVLNLGIVDTNHFGLPWVAHLEGELCGVLQIKGTVILIDALTGKVLQNIELEERLNNYKFDYENKAMSRLNID